MILYVCVCVCVCVCVYSYGLDVNWEWRDLNWAIVFINCDIWGGWCYEEEALVKYICVLRLLLRLLRLFVWILELWYMSMNVIM